MAKKPTFMLALRNLPSVETPYTPLMYTRGTQTHRLALVKRFGQWQVCDIGTGALVLRVVGYPGMFPVSNGFTLAQARQHAMDNLDTLVDRIGLPKFESVLSNPKPK